MIYLINKPKGITSFDVIRKLRKKLGIKKMGHSGTLDPLASGLMIVATEKDTKKLNKYLKLPKTYIAEILLGISTTTGDMEGDVVEKSDVGNLNIKKAVLELKGKHKLSVPIYSAIKVKGKPLYWYARKGIETECPVKDMKVFDIRYIGMSENIVKIEIDVSSGTYIRSLAVELGRRLGVPSVLYNLHRTRIGKFEVDNAIKDI